MQFNNFYPSAISLYINNNNNIGKSSSNSFQKCKFRIFSFFVSHFVLCVIIISTSIIDLNLFFFQLLDLALWWSCSNYILFFRSYTHTYVMTMKRFNAMSIIFLCVVCLVYLFTHNWLWMRPPS
jgi:hypothetical protein